MYKKREREACGGKGGRKMERGRMQKPHRIRRCFSCFRRAALLCMAAAPPVTSHISIQEAVFVLLFFFPPCLAKREGGREGGIEGGREEKVTLALKPAIVFPPGQPANQAAQSEREREREGKRGRERERRLPWLPPGRCEHTCLSVGRGSVHGGALSLSRCVCVRV